MANQALALLESALRARKLDRTLTSLQPEFWSDVRDAARFAPTGIPRVDEVLGGGFPRGQFSEIVGAASSGRTTVLLNMLGEVSRRGDISAFIDTFDQLDSASLVNARIATERMLWVRGTSQASGAVLERTIDRALKAFNLVLQAGGFGLVVLDVSEAPVLALKRLPLTTWLRIQRTIEGSETACVVMASRPLARSAGGVTLTLDTRTSRARWSGESDRSRLLAGLDVEGRAISSRRRVDGAFAFAASTRH